MTGRLPSHHLRRPEPTREEQSKMRTENWDAIGSKDLYLTSILTTSNSELVITVSHERLTVWQAELHHVSACVISLQPCTLLRLNPPVHQLTGGLWLGSLNLDSERVSERFTDYRYGFETIYAEGNQGICR